jgi:glucokinase
VEFYSIGVDLGGTNLRVASFDHNNGLRDSIELSTRRQDGRDAIISDLGDAVQSLIQKFTGLQECVGIGVATPGPMELPEGRLLNPPNLPGWENFELRQVLERRLRRTVVVENDANVAALAECVLGQGKELKVNSLCMVTLGTGVGSGIILNGRIWHGMNGMAASQATFRSIRRGRCVRVAHEVVWSCRHQQLALSGWLGNASLRILSPE